MGNYSIIEMNFPGLHCLGIFFVYSIMDILAERSTSMKKLFSTILLVILLVVSLPSGAKAGNNITMPNITPEMQEEGFWISKLKDADKVILGQSQISLFNQAVIAKLPDTVYDLRQYPGELKRDILVSMITVPKLPEKTKYINGQLASADYYRHLNEQCNINGIAPITKMQYGFTVERVSIRTFPTDDCVTSQPDDREFDDLQETTLDPAEPVIILHQSLNKAWYYVQAYNYRGWLSAGSVAIAASRQEWLEYVDAAEFLTVIDSKLTIGDKQFAMGSKLPLADRKNSSLLIDRLTANGSYAVKLPVRGARGELAFELVQVAVNDQVIKGYLPYTRSNIIRQAFKLQGERYGWGGMYGGWDCSALVLDVYRSFGLTLPRNADEQEMAAGRTVVLSGSTKARAEQIMSLEPGAGLYMPGHTTLYLGENEGRQFIIHAVAGYNTPDGRVPVMRVVVSDLNLTLRSGKQYLEAMTTGKQFQ